MLVTVALSVVQQSYDILVDFRWTETDTGGEFACSGGRWWTSADDCDGLQNRQTYDFLSRRYLRGAASTFMGMANWGRIFHYLGRRRCRQLSFLRFGCSWW